MYLITPGMVQKMAGDPSFTVSAIMLGLEILQGHGQDRPSCTIAGTTAETFITDRRQRFMLLAVLFVLRIRFLIERL